MKILEIVFPQNKLISKAQRKEEFKEEEKAI